MTLLLRLLGTLLLLLAGMGGGFAAAARAENSRRQLHSFARLLTYLAELLDAQALTGPELLRRRGGSAPDGLCRAAPPGFAL